MSRVFSLAASALVLSAALAPPRVGGDELESSAERAQALVDFVKKESEAQTQAPSILGEIDPKEASAYDRTIARTLRTRKVDLRLEAAPVADLVRLLAEISELNVVLTAKARAALQATPREVTVKLRGLTLEQTFNVLSRQLGEYRFVLRYGAVMLALRDEFPPPQITRFYLVEDIVRARPDFAAPRLALEPRDPK